MSKSAKLIVLRGQSGSGKSTVANILQENAKQPLVVLEQDYYRKYPLKTLPNGLRRELMVKMLLADIFTCLDSGLDVLVEGMFSSEKYKPLIEEMFRRHPTNNYVFWFDISFAETLRRHQTREKLNDFGEDEMKEWYFKNEPHGFEFEYQISESNTLEQTVSYIQKTANL